jgi:hypothetical protein
MLEVGRSAETDASAHQEEEAYPVFHPIFLFKLKYKRRLNLTDSFALRSFAILRSIRKVLVTHQIRNLKRQK